MCRNYAIYDPPLDDDQYWDALLDEQVKQYTGNYAVWPKQEAPVMWQSNGDRRMSLFHFGLIPSWTKQDDKDSWPYRAFNARDDKLLESNLWEPLITSKRCIIPANGFFEPHKYHREVQVSGGPKPTDSIPFYFELKSSDVFGFAGIWDEWTDKQTGEVIQSFSIITTGPNKTIKKVHNKKPRTPLILAREDYDFWLSDLDKPKDLFEAGLFEPWADDDMEYWQVTKQLDYNGQGKELIEPVDDPVDIDAGPAEQGSLF